jgi:hypothetical protein
MEFNSVSLSSRELPNEEFMPSKRTLFCLKPTRDVRVTGMTCSYPPEVWRPVTIVVVTYKHRGNNPIKDVTSDGQRTERGRQPGVVLTIYASREKYDQIGPEAEHRNLLLANQVCRPHRVESNQDDLGKGEGGPSLC